MTDGEKNTFMKMFEGYYQHIRDNPSSLIARIYGIFTVKMEDIIPVNLLLMANTVRIERP